MNHYYTVLLTLCLSLSISSHTQAQSLFQYLYQTEVAVESYAEPSANGEIILAADTYNDTADFFHRLLVQRLDVDGQVLQTTGLFRPPSFRMTGGIKATSDNGLLMMGTVNIPLEDEDSVFVIKLDGADQVQWTKGFQIEPTIHEPRGAIETSDGSYLIYGTYEHVNFASGIFLIKMDDAGTLIWSRIINSQLAGAFMKVGGIVETITGEYWLSGSTRFNSEGSWLAKLNNMGESQSVTFLNTHQLTPSQPEPFALHQRNNGELDIFYNSTGFDSGPVLLAIHTDASGSPIQTTRFLNGENFGEMTEIRPSGDGGYLAAGYQFPNSALRSNGLAMKIASDYSIMWSNSYGADYIENTTSIFPTSDGGHLLSGFADFDSLIISPSENGLFPWLLKTDAQGATTCYEQSSSMSTSDTSTSTMSYQLDNVAGVALGDIVFNNISIHAEPSPVTCAAMAIDVLPTTQFSLYPNPSEGIVWIETESQDIESVVLYDLFGRQLEAELLFQPHRIEIRTRYQGIALVKIQTEEGLWSGKAVFR